MGVKGPLKVPRPLARHRIVISHKGVTLERVGPFGLKRPLTHTNPEVSESRMRQCMQSEAANKFAKGLVDPSSPAAGSFLHEGDDGDIYLNREKLNNAKESWCRGILLSTMREADMEDRFPPEEDIEIVFEDEEGEQEELPGPRALVQP